MSGNVGLDSGSGFLSYNNNYSIMNYCIQLLPAVDHGLIDSSRTSRWGREAIS